MIGDAYWATGISIRWDGRGAWVATVNFCDDGFCDDESTEGVLHTRYYIDLDKAIDTVKADAEKLGVEWRHSTGDPKIYVEQDGEDPNLVPEDWARIVDGQSRRIGWR